MNIRHTIFWTSGALVLIVALTAAWFMLFRSPEPVSPSPSPVVTLPVSGDITPSAVEPQPGVASMSVPGYAGGSIQTKNFIRNGTTVPDASNNGRYLIAGDLGYCVSDPSACRAGSTTDFNIFFESETGSFTIALLVEPLGQTRRVMEEYLARTLGITQADMCQLNYYVGTTADINSLYATKNLGFSFCPGATKLPE